MPSAFESASLNLQLFDLRREPVLREARNWFLLEFNPSNFAEFSALAGGERNASFRMVISYWDMAASLVTTGAIDADAFRAAQGEVFATFSKIHPYLSELRAASGEPDFCKHMETVVMAVPDAEQILARCRDATRAFRRDASDSEKWQSVLTFAHYVSNGQCHGRHGLPNRNSRQKETNCRELLIMFLSLHRNACPRTPDGIVGETVKPSRAKFRIADHTTKACGRTICTGRAISQNGHCGLLLDS
jgi:hypothetical protein